MNKFFVGQRVRLVRPKFPKNMGREGRIKQLGHFDCFGGVGDCVVIWDGVFADWVQHTSQLEPILPEGAAPSEFTTLHDLLNSLEGVAA